MIGSGIRSRPGSPRAPSLDPDATTLTGTELLWALFCPPTASVGLSFSASGGMITLPDGLPWTQFIFSKVHLLQWRDSMTRKGVWVSPQCGGAKIRAVCSPGIVGGFKGYTPSYYSPSSTQHEGGLKVRIRSCNPTACSPPWLSAPLKINPTAFLASEVLFHLDLTSPS